MRLRQTQLDNGETSGLGNIIHLLHDLIHAS